MRIIENWYARSYHMGKDAGFLTPECNPTVISGEVYRHPDFPDGEKIKTPAIVKAEGRVVTTERGEEYELGEPHPEYLKWLASEGRTYNHAHPFTVKVKDKA